MNAKKAVRKFLRYYHTIDHFPEQSFVVSRGGRAYQVIKQRKGEAVLKKPNGELTHCTYNDNSLFILFSDLSEEMTVKIKKEIEKQKKK